MTDSFDDLGRASAGPREISRRRLLGMVITTAVAGAWGELFSDEAFGKPKPKCKTSFDCDLNACQECKAKQCVSACANTDTPVCCHSVCRPAGTLVCSSGSQCCVPPLNGACCGGSTCCPPQWFCCPNAP